MRKLFSLLLVALLLTNAISPVLGSGYRETALAYLSEKYGVPQAEIELYEGGITELEFTAESFWTAKYALGGEGEAVPGFTGGEQPQTLPAPDQPADSHPSILPLPMPDRIDDNQIYGGISIRVKTGEILEMEVMETFYTAEWRLAELEWERLRQEAGKLDVPLYRKLSGLASVEKVSVWIQPTPVFTTSLRSQFSALQVKYPTMAPGMELEAMLGYGFDTPGETRLVGPSNAVDLPAVDGDTPVTAAAPPNAIEPAMPLDKAGDGIMPVEPNDGYRQEYSAFWEELEQIRVQAIAPSLVSIKGSLDTMGITYGDNGNSVTADLTKVQIQSIAGLDSVAAVYEEMLYTTMDGSEILMARGSLADDKSALPPTESGGNGNTLFPLFLGALLVAGLTVAFTAYSRRTAHSS